MVDVLSAVKKNALICFVIFVFFFVSSTSICSVSCGPVLRWIAVAVEQLFLISHFCRFFFVFFLLLCCTWVDVLFLLMVRWFGVSVCENRLSKCEVGG